MASLIDTIIKELRTSAEEKSNHALNYHQDRGDKYYASYEDNLFWGCLSVYHSNSFDDAQGGELNSKGDKPAKMSAIRSSSALAVNIFGNDYQVEIIDNQINLPAGKYELKYEETNGTTITSEDAKGVNKHHHANIDVRLSNPDAEIFIEVKGLEPLLFSPKVNEAYVISNYYNQKLGSELIKKFIDVFGLYNVWAQDKSQKNNPVRCFDACQMFKHLLAILDLLIRGKLESKNVVLVNCHWDFETFINGIITKYEKFTSEKPLSKRSVTSFNNKCEQYQKAKEQYENFMKELIPLLDKSRLLDNLTIMNCTHTQMIEALQLQPEHKTYLERYSMTE